MTEDMKKIVTVASCLVLIIVLLLIAFFADIDLKIVKFTSIKSLLAKHSEIEQSDANLLNKENEYNNNIKKVEDAQKTFDSEKTKYETITNETVNIIKEATTEENYNIEYMWIRLGNYAKSNNLKIIMAEPGGTFEDDTESANKDGSTSTTTTTSSTSTTTKTTTTTTDTKTGDDDADAKDSSESQNTTSSSTSSNTLFKIQVTGSYLDVADFVFEVENDNALRFKLDNISMDYVSGTTIKAKFNVKGLVFNVQ